MTEAERDTSTGRRRATDTRPGTQWRGWVGEDNRC